MVTEERLHETGARFATSPRKTSGPTHTAYRCPHHQHEMQQDCCISIRMRHMWFTNLTTKTVKQELLF